MQYIVSPASEVQSFTTLASTNQSKNTADDMIMVFSEDEEENLQGKLVKSSKGPQSKERKLSNEELPMLPPRAKEGAILRPCAKFNSTSTIFNKSKATADQQALKPKSILGFLQQSVSGNLQGNSKKRVEKAGIKSLEAFSLLSSTGKPDASVPGFTLG